MYNYIIPFIIFIIIGIVLYFRYNIKEGFQLDASSNGIDINSVNIIEPNIGDISNMTPIEAALHVNSVIKPLIASTPDLQGVIANDQVSVIQLPPNYVPPVNPSYTTAVDTRPITDISKQCTMLNNQLNVLINNIDKYKKLHNWDEVRGMSSAIEDIQKELIKLQC
jgi:hypothetical protein